MEHAANRAAPGPAAEPEPVLLGIDFSSAPSRRKPIVFARGERHGAAVRLQQLDRFDTLTAFGDWLVDIPAWIGGFDLPFGLPRELVETLGWPTDWRECIAHYARMTRSTWQGKNPFKSLKFHKNRVFQPFVFME